MNNTQFIKKAIDAINNQENYQYHMRSGSLKTYDNVLFSYGSHYPLFWAITIGDYQLRFINVTGYSNTTAKHINIARSIAPYAIPLKGCKHTYSIEATISTISNQIDQLEDDINKMRPGTKKQRVAQAQQDQLRDNLKKIQHVVKVGK